jgi:quercetin dioxygenase-like cupin family protein
MSYSTEHPPKIQRAKPYTVGHSAGQSGHCLLTGSDTAGALSLWVSIVHPGSHAPLHVHSREDETFFLLSGEIEARIGDEYHTLLAGDSVFLPRGVPHRLANVSSAPAEFVMLIHPPALENFFMEIDRITSDGPTSPEIMQEAAARYGVTIIG